MHQIRVKSHFSHEYLNKRTIECDDPMSNGTLKGIGIIESGAHSDSSIYVDILQISSIGFGEYVTTEYHLPQALVDRISIHADKAVADFRLR